MGKILDLYEKDPKLALDHLFEEGKSKTWREQIFVWSSQLGICGKIHYGSFKYFTRQDLDGREYDIEYGSEGISLRFTDVYFDPRINIMIPKGCIEMIEDMKGFTTGTPTKVGEYQASMDPPPMPSSLRYYWNGEYWSNPYHTHWPKTSIEKSKSTKSSFQWMRYWRAV